MIHPQDFQVFSETQKVFPVEPEVIPKDYWEVEPSGNFFGVIF